ncbi:MAG: hypothetical protein ACLSG5_01635 [Oscillospiraceae bacterium]
MDNFRALTAGYAQLRQRMREHSALREAAGPWSTRCIPTTSSFDVRRESYPAARGR